MRPLDSREGINEARLGSCLAWFDPNAHRVPTHPQPRNLCGSASLVVTGDSTAPRPGPGPHKYGGRRLSASPLTGMTAHGQRNERAVVADMTMPRCATGASSLGCLSW